MKRRIVIDQWSFIVIKENKNSLILEKEGNFYRLCKHSKKFSHLKG